MAPTSGIFPGWAAGLRLVGAVLLEQTDEWAEQRRYMGVDVLAKARLRLLPAQPKQPEVMTPDADTAHVQTGSRVVVLIHHSTGRDRQELLQLNYGSDHGRR